MSESIEGVNAGTAIGLWDEIEIGLHRARRKDVADSAAARVEPFRIFGPLYYVGDRGVCVHLVDSGDGLVLFDSGFPNMTAHLFENIAHLGFRPEDVRHVIHSHEHFDHFGATPILQARCGAKTYIHRQGADTFRVHPHHTELQSSYWPAAALFRPDVEMEDGDEIEIGDLLIRCVHTPGHSAGSVSFFFDVSEGGRILRAGLCGLGGTLPLHAGRLLKYGIPLATRDEYAASIVMLEGEQVDITLDTHPRPDGILDRRATSLRGGDAEAFIGGDVWRRTLRDYRARFRDFMETQKFAFLAQ